MADPRRQIRRTDVVLADGRLSEALSNLGHDTVKAAVVSSQQRARAGEIAAADVVLDALRSLSASQCLCSLRPVLNATGVIVHTNLGRAPLSEAARAALIQAAGYTDVEFDLVEGARARRGRGALAALAEAVPAARAVHVVNNTAAALLLTAMVLAPGREIVISRGELVEIGDGFRIPELLASTGARLREVGTTNRTHLSDYAEAMGAETGFILKVHTSNFRVEGFTAAVDVADLSTLGVPVVADIGSGLLHPHPLLPSEPDATSCLAAGADLVLASGDKLLGGPQAGLMLGGAELVERLRRFPAARALRVDKLTLAALEVTLRGPVTPVAQALSVSAAELRSRADALAVTLPDGVDVAVVQSSAAVGGGGAPGQSLPSWALSLPESYLRPLRSGSPAVVGRLERGRCVLDLRAIPPEADEQLRTAISAVSSEAPQRGRSLI